MPFELLLSSQVGETLALLERTDQRRYKKVVRCLAKLEEDPVYPGLNSHPFESVKGPRGERIWESYVENNAPSAWRVWWHYGPGTSEITIFAVGPHP